MSSGLLAGADGTWGADERPPTGIDCDVDQSLAAARIAAAYNRRTRADLSAASGENLVEPALDPLGLALDVVAVHRDDLEALEIGRAGRRRNIDAHRIPTIGGEDLLGVIADHELREQFRSIRMRRALHHRCWRGNDEDTIGRV